MMEENIADTMAKAHKAISIAEFFEKNKHLLGYENLQKSLLTVVREGVDNSLDACEEARILPDIYVELQKKANADARFKVIIEDNGPGIVKKNIPKIFGKLLYGSKFHRLRQSRGQQGIGISAAVLYGQLTTGKSAKIYSRINDGKTHIYELHIDIQTNEPVIVSEDTVYGTGHGTRIEIEVKGRYVKGKQSIYEYLQQTAIMNPFSKIVFVDPEGEKFEFPRAVDELPKEPREIMPHASGIELGTMLRMMKNTKSRMISGFLASEFSRISSEKAKELCVLANVDPKVSPSSLTRDEADALHEQMQKAKLQNPPTDCLSPIGAKPIEEGLKKELNPEFVSAVSRSATVYAGNPFLVEVGIAYGGSLDPEGSVQIMRFANKVPLLYEQSACAITKSVIQTDWRRYKLSQSGGSLPVGPVAITVHFASVWVPYTSEGKEAIAAYPIIIKEIRLAMQEAARRLGLYLSKKRRANEAEEKKALFHRYIRELAGALHDLTGKDGKVIESQLSELITEKLKTMIIEDAEEGSEQSLDETIDDENMVDGDVEDDVSDDRDDEDKERGE
ncbi:MAG: DNA topoisomerase VI subunit B [archaeon]